MKRPLITTGALGAALIGSAILAAPASAWDELPCGATEATAHLCAPGEKARDGSTPNPAPVVVPPPVVVVPAPQPTPTPAPSPEPTPVVPATPVTPTVKLSCSDLRDAVVLHHAGGKWKRILRDRCGIEIAVVPITCAELERRKAGLLRFTERSCPIPLRFRVPGPFVAVPVTG